VWVQTSLESCSRQIGTSQIFTACYSWFPVRLFSVAQPISSNAPPIEIHSKHWIHGYPLGTPSTNDLIIRDIYALSSNDTTKFSDWVASNLPGQPWMSLLTGDDDMKRRAKILPHFAPLAANRELEDLDDPVLQEKVEPFREESIEILVATDVLSEGQNLQDAQYLINYDLHWNPVRMIQRGGRIDRLFSPHKEVYIFNVMPEQGLEDILKIVSRLLKRAKAIDATIGLDASLLGEQITPLALDQWMAIKQGGSAAGVKRGRVSMTLWNS